eukprot:m.215471 g.215471  ORF g.215471 m.215471 type:complete len:316 (-) comp17199_c0_seq2:1931-2878(-)
MALELDVLKLCKFVKKHEEPNLDSLLHWMTEHMYLTGLYYGIMLSQLLGQPSLLKSPVNSIQQCYDQTSGGYGGAPGYPAHALYTYSAVQLACLLKEPTLIDADKVVPYLWSLVDPVTGGVRGDLYSDIDTRFCYCVLGALALLQQLDPHDPRCEPVRQHLLACQNDDGGFGLFPDSESHAGQTFCSLASLALLESLDGLKREPLLAWLQQRQQSDGGFNGRPEKTSDSCYSWWVGASLSILGCKDSINTTSLERFLATVDSQERGGFSARPDETPDLFHTHFTVAALGLLPSPKVDPVHPVFCLPVSALPEALQ